MKNLRFEAVAIAIGLLLLGIFIKQGMSSFADKDRSVNVKGLAEMEVPADKVTWPLVYKSLGNDLVGLYDQINKSNKTITQFLISKGIDEKEISINAPEIIDMKAERYGNQETSYRYNVTSVITVTSDKVDLIRNLISSQGELLKQGVAVTSGDYRYNVQYEYTGLNKIKPQMIAEATKNARTAAEQFAHDSGSKVGKIKTATQGFFSIENAAEDLQEKKTIRVVTTVEYLLK